MSLVLFCSRDQAEQIRIEVLGFGFFRLLDALSSQLVLLFGKGQCQGRSSAGDVISLRESQEVDSMPATSIRCCNFNRRSCQIWFVDIHVTRTRSVPL